jgi:thioredoxin-dependent peroxiredoxin
MHTHKITMILCIALILMFGCAKQKSQKMTGETVEPGTQVSFKGTPHKLLGTPVKIGKRLPSVNLVDAMSLADVDLSKEKGSVLFLSIVTSIDTPVCEAQTHFLGEQGDRLAPRVKRIVISRDTPFAQKRFAEEAKLKDLQYLSDYKEGAFGRATGLLTDDLMLLARAVIIVDKQGIVQYIQVVPEITLLPDMDTAFKKALELAEK